MKKISFSKAVAVARKEETLNSTWSDESKAWVQVNIRGGVDKKIYLRNRRVMRALEKLGVPPYTAQLVCALSGTFEGLVREAAQRLGAAK